MNFYRIIRRLPITKNSELRLRRWKLERDYDGDRRAAVKSGSPDQWEDAHHYLFDFQELEEDENRHHSSELLERARELRLPTPAVYGADGRLSDDWQRSGVDGLRYFLSLTGEQRVRQAIREEEKHRSEVWGRRIPYVAALSGLIGTVTGLVAVLLK